MSDTSPPTSADDATPEMDAVDEMDELGEADGRSRAGLGANYHRLFAASTISNLGDGISVIAYPWLASAVTRNGLLIALVAVVQRLPWLIFSLPAGVLTDRHDRRTLMVVANWSRAVLTLGVAGVVLARQAGLASPDELAAGVAVSEDYLLYGVVLAATLALGVAEVLYDNSAQTVMPALVPASRLEKANGRLWSVEQAANTFGGPPLGALLLTLTFAAPFLVDAATFALSAALISLIPRGLTSPVSDRAGADRADDRPSWRTELAEGFRWLWAHELLRPLAVTLGLLNMLGTLSGAALVLYAQEVLDTSPTEFALLTTGAAVGAIAGGWAASPIAARIGSGPSLALTLLTGGITTIIIGLVSWWPIVWILFSTSMFFGVLWNVITVSFRQTVIPDRLLGRVNSVYRFFGWGMMPIGALLGGLIIVVTESVADRELALRMPWLLAGAAHFVLFVFAAPRLTTARMDAARAAAGAPPAAAPTEGRSADG